MELITYTYAHLSGINKHPIYVCLQRRKKCSRLGRNKVMHEALLFIYFGRVARWGILYLIFLQLDVFLYKTISVHCMT